MIDYSTEQLLNLFKQTYYNETGNTLTIGSDEFAFSSVAAYVMRVLEQAINTQINNNSFETASGSQLDAIARMYNFERWSAKPAQVTLKLYDSTGTAYISEGLQVTSNGFTFKTKHPVQFSANEKTVYIFAYCTFEGVAANDLPADSFETPVAADLGITSITVEGESYNGSESITEYNDENDNIFREYVRDNMSGFQYGTAHWYENKVKYWDQDLILDACCLRQNDNGYTPGIAKIYIIFADGLPTGDRKAALLELYDMLSEDKTRPICDGLGLFDIANTILPALYIGALGFGGYRVVYPKIFTAEQCKAHYEETMEGMKTYLAHGFKRPYSSAELSRRFLLTNSEGVYALSFDDVSSNVYVEPHDAEDYLPMYYEDFENGVSNNRITFE